MAAAKIGAIQAKLQDESREFQKLEAGRCSSVKLT
jgi:hypothetical protein